MSENILWASKPVEIAEYQDYKLATFLISVLDEYDLNGRLIPLATAQACGDTLVGAPIVAKLIYNPLTGQPCNFGDHAVYWSTDADGNEVLKFGTEAIGSITKQWIELRTVDGFNEQKNCLMTQVKLWSSRYPEYIAVLDKLWAVGKVSSSWELTINEAVQTIQGRILNAITFLGNCIIGVDPAVPQAGMVEYASKQDEDEIQLAIALSKDMAKAKEIPIQEDKILDDKNKEPEQATVVVDSTPTEPTVPPVVASLTMYDLRSKLNEACRTKFGNWCWTSYVFPEDHICWCEYDGGSELDYLKFTYEVTNDVVTVSEPEKVKLTVSVAQINTVISEKDAEIATKVTEISQKDDALVSANSTIEELKTTIATLEPFKVEHEKLEAERIAAELAQKQELVKNTLIASKLFKTTELDNDEIKAVVDGGDMVAAKAIIADRFMASLEKPKTETATATAKPASIVNNDADSEKFTFDDFMDHYHK